MCVFDNVFFIKDTVVLDIKYLYTSNQSTLPALQIMFMHGAELM
jgi:hypothetical protein